MLALGGIILTILAYMFCKWLYRRVHLVVLTPIITTFALLVIVLVATHFPYPTYMHSAKWLTNLLGPSIVAFAVPLHKNFQLLKRHAFTILASISTGACVALTSSFLLARLFGLQETVAASVAPRSVTTPIAMEISKVLGGIPTLTAVCVILTALIGIVMGPLLIRWYRIPSAIGKGAMMGMGAHGIGTSKAFEFGHLEGTYASLSMILSAAVSVVASIPMAYLLHP